MFVSRWVRRAVSCGSCSNPPLLSRRFSCAAQEIEEEGGVLSKRALMQQEGFTEQQIKAVLKLNPRSDKLSWLLTILKDRDITGPTAGSFVSSQSHLLLHGNLNNFRLRLEILHDAGMERNVLKKTIMQCSGLMSCSTSPENLQKHLSFLKDVGLCPSNSLLALLRAPSFLKLGIDTRLKPRCKFLQQRGISEEGICKLLRNFPRVFTGSQPYLIQKLDFVEEFGFDLTTKAGVRALGLWSGYSVENLIKKLKFIESLGVPHEEVVAMAKKQPSVLCMRDDHLKKKIDFVLHTLNSSVKETLKCPSFFTCSFEKRILPRFAIVNELRKKGLLKKRVPVGSVVSVSEKDFQRRFKAALEETTCNSGSASEEGVRKKKSKGV